MSEALEQIKQAVLEGKHREIEALVRAALHAGESPARIMEEALRTAMDDVGKRFADGEIYVPEMVVAAAAMKKGIEVIEPLLKGEELAPQGRVVMATVRGDIHDIGKNLVSILLEGAGFEVTDLGVDVGADKIVRSVARLKPHVLGLSALLSTTMHEMPRVITALEGKGLRKDVKIMIGGAPLSSTFAERIGADAYGRDAAEAVQLARSFMDPGSGSWGQLISPDPGAGGPGDE